jgi:hypothetical protein
MRGFEPTGPYMDDAGQVLSVARDLAVLRHNVGLVDQLSYRPMNTFDSSAQYDTAATPNHYLAPPDDVRIWLGWIRWQAGMTTLTIQGAAGDGGAERIYVYLNGVQQGTLITPTASWSQGYAFGAAQDYSEGQIVLIELVVKGAGRAANAWYIVTDIYAAPVAAAASWPGVPTFTTVFTAAKLTQLQTAAQWLYDRMTGIPHVARRTLRYVNGPFKDPASDAPHGAYPLYYGGVLRGYSEDALRIEGQVITPTATVRLKGQINGITALDGVATTFTPGTHSFAANLSLAGVAVGARAWVGLYAEVLDAGAQPWRQSKWTFHTIRSQGTYPAALLPAGFSTSDTPEQVRDKLNSLATVLSNAYARVNANGAVWDRVRAMRQWYGVSDDTNGVRDIRHRPQLRRQGDRLLVSGKGVDLRFGAVSVPTADIGRDLDYDRHSFAESHNLIAADKAETTTIYLDSIPGLYPGTLYELHGEVTWGAEIG